MAADKYKLIIDASLLAGRIMLENGAETGRVEETMERMISTALGVEYRTASFTYVTVNGIFVNVGMDNTNFVRIDNRDYNLEKVTKVNQISRKYAEGSLTVEEVLKELKAVDQDPLDFPLWLKLVCTAILSGSVMLIMKGTFIDLPASMIGGLFCYIVYLIGLKLIKTPFIVEYMAAFLGGIVAYYINSIVGSQLNSVMIGTVAPLVPGIAMTNAIRDMMAKHYLSGTIRLVEAIFIAGAIGTGVATVYYLFIN